MLAGFNRKICFALIRHFLIKNDKKRDLSKVERVHPLELD